MASQLTASARYSCDLPPDQVLAALGDAVEPLDGGFQFVSKLSGGGVVIRVLRAPATDRGWFGTIDGPSFSIAKVTSDASGSPFQPILRGEVHAREQGSTVAVELATHPDARMFSIFFTAGGVLLGGASLLALSQSLITAVTGLTFAALFLLFPGVRARMGFAQECGVSLSALEQQLALQPLPETHPPEPPPG
ncbi:MAG: hypothetical protein KDA24_11420 [Deltaproteobacteria bacterium]|nr:hypothetical protein [Deltaproteobacteria bacterium]